MFGEPKGEAGAPDFGAPGFDDGAFGQGSFDQGGGGMNFGTPAPDFSGDTGAPAAAVATPAKPVKATKPQKSSGGGVGVLGLIAAIVIFTVVGLAAGVYFADKMAFMSFAPIFGQLAERDSRIAKLETTVKSYNDQYQIRRRRGVRREDPGADQAERGFCRLTSLR